MPIENPIILRDHYNNVRSINYESLSNFKNTSLLSYFNYGTLNFSYIEIDNRIILHLVHYVPRSSNINFSTGYILFIN